MHVGDSPFVLSTFQPQRKTNFLWMKDMIYWNRYNKTNQRFFEHEQDRHVWLFKLRHTNRSKSGKLENFEIVSPVRNRSVMHWKNLWAFTRSCMCTDFVSSIRFDDLETIFYHLVAKWPLTFCKDLFFISSPDIREITLLEKATILRLSFFPYICL